MSLNGDVCKSTGGVTLHKNPDYRFAGGPVCNSDAYDFSFFLGSESGF